DFNNLLGVIDANLLYLSEGINRTADPEIAEVLEETQSALGHAKVITAGMLSLSRAGGIQCERVELRVVFDELIGILRHLLPRIIDAQFDVAADLTAFSNAAFLQSALLNLVLNARDAMPDGGQLKLTASAQPTAPESPPRLGIAPIGAHVAICISDTGHGMRPETLERIFEPLFSTKAKQRGHGLGLFMVQEFVIRSGAALTVDSRLGEGTEFRLLLPGATELPDDAEDLNAMLSMSINKVQRVLLVDDDPRIREAIGRLLTAQGWRFCTAEHGADALQLLSADSNFDFVLSDIAMPIMDGFSLFEKMAKEHPQLPVILMSGQDLQPDCHIDCKHHHAHCPSVLRKPLDMQQLLHTVELVCADALPRCQPHCVFKSETVSWVDAINPILTH
ncbi:response regulator, partial [Chromatium okenii]